MKNTHLLIVSAIFLTTLAAGTSGHAQNIAQQNVASPVSTGAIGQSPSLQTAPAQPAITNAAQNLPPQIAAQPMVTGAAPIAPQPAPPIQAVTPPQATDMAPDQSYVSTIIARLRAWFALPKSRTEMEADAKKPPPPSEQDQAIQLARDGQYDKALAILDRLHQQNQADQKITRDIAVILSWSGRNQDAVTLYETLPPPQPDYVLATMGRAYRALNQTDKALAAYRLGLQQSPDSVQFAEGEIRCLVDENKLDDALSAANTDISRHGDRPYIAAVKKDILQLIDQRDEQKAVELGRAGQYQQALAILSDLHGRHADDIHITQDYLTVMSWAGGRDAEVIALYKTLPPGAQPDYVMGVAGHSYRQIKQFAEAQAVYEQGLQQHPDSVMFAEGVIRTLADQKKYKAALTLADQNLRAYGNRPQIVDIRKNILRLKTSGRKSS